MRGLVAPVMLVVAQRRTSSLRMGVGTRTTPVEAAGTGDMGDRGEWVMQGAAFFAHVLARRSGDEAMGVDGIVLLGDSSLSQIQQPYTLLSWKAVLVSLSFGLGPDSSPLGNEGPASEADSAIRTLMYVSLSLNAYTPVDSSFFHVRYSRHVYGCLSLYRRSLPAHRHACASPRNHMSSLTSHLLLCLRDDEPLRPSTPPSMRRAASSRHRHGQSSPNLIFLRYLWCA